MIKIYSRTHIYCNAKQNEVEPQLLPNVNGGAMKDDLVTLPKIQLKVFETIVHR